jgi:hypothetical protein
VKSYTARTLSSDFQSPPWPGRSGANGHQQVDGEIVGAVGGHRQVEGFGQIADFMNTVTPSQLVTPGSGNVTPPEFYRPLSPNGPRLSSIPARGRRIQARAVGDELAHGVQLVDQARDVVPVENALGLVAANAHGHRFRHAPAHHVTDRGPAEVVEPEPGAVGFLEGDVPPVLASADTRAVVVEHERGERIAQFAGLPRRSIRSASRPTMGTVRACPFLSPARE